MGNNLTSYFYLKSKPTMPLISDLYVGTYYKCYFSILDHMQWKEFLVPFYLPTRLLLTETVVDLEMILQKYSTYFVAVVLYPNFKLIHGFIK